jgi:futalosine hydrolase
MKILLVAATIFEVRPLLGKLAHRDTENERLHHYSLNDSVIDVLIPGVGMIPTAYHTGRQLAGDRYDLCINAGIGGSYTKDLKIGEVVEVTEECVTELGAEARDGFLSVFDLGLIDPDSSPYRNGRLINENPVNSRIIGNLRKVKGATANTIHGSRDSIVRILEKFNPEEESMEGAACFYAFLSEQTPFAEIRAISNFVEERDKSRWNLELALKNLNNTLTEVLREVCQG